NIGDDSVAVSLLVEAGGKGLDVQIQLPGEADELLAPHVLLVCEQDVVIFPELILLVSAFGRQRSLIRGLAEDHKITVNELDLIAIAFQQRPQRLFRKASAVRTAEVAELEDGDRRIGRPDGWVTGNRNLIAFFRVGAPLLLPARLPGKHAGNRAFERFLNGPIVGQCPCDGLFDQSSVVLNKTVVAYSANDNTEE